MKAKKTCVENVFDVGHQTFDVIETILRAIRERYPADVTVPGLVMAHIPADRPFPGHYVSICRYPCGNKEVVQNFTAPTLARALLRCVQFLATPKDLAAEKLAGWL